MNGIVYVGIAEYHILDEPGILACGALGSCVGVCLWDTQTKLAGLLHVLLPSTKDATDRTNPCKFADLGTELLVRDMESRGAKRARLRAKLVGGACIYYYARACVAAEIGKRNVHAARDTLARLDIPIIAEHVGGMYGRSIQMRQEDFSVRVQVLSQGVTVI